LSYDGLGKKLHIHAQYERADCINYHFTGDQMPDSNDTNGYDDYDQWFQSQDPGINPMCNGVDWNSWAGIEYCFNSSLHPTGSRSRQSCFVNQLFIYIVCRLIFFVLVPWQCSVGWFQCRAVSIQLQRLFAILPQSFISQTTQFVILDTTFICNRS
jgi:hypothetical protein